MTSISNIFRGNVAKKSKYQIFLILSTARSGTNYLQSILKGDSVSIMGELFNLNTLPQEKIKSILIDPLSYLKDNIEKYSSKSVTHLGFKMFYYHATKKSVYLDNERWLLKDANESLKNRIVGYYNFLQENYDLSSLGEKLEEVWNFIAENKKIMIIHLKRKNKLETLLSLKKAFITNIWTHSSEKKSEQLSIHLDYNECVKFFDQTEDFEKDYDNFFQNNPLLNIYYEDLISNPKNQIVRIKKFLKLKKINSISHLKKQNKLKLSESISNYFELKTKFLNTSRIEYFSE
jgi:LPS sulfotransferase NodH